MTRRLAALATALAGVVTLASSLSAERARAPGACSRRSSPAAPRPPRTRSALLGGLADAVAGGRRPARAPAGRRAAVVVLGVLARRPSRQGPRLRGGADRARARVRAAPWDRAGEHRAARRRARWSAMLALLVGIAGAYASTLTVLLVSGHSAGLGPTLWVAAPFARRRRTRRGRRRRTDAAASRRRVARRRRRGRAARAARARAARDGHGARRARPRRRDRRGARRRLDRAVRAARRQGVLLRPRRRARLPHAARDRRRGRRPGRAAGRAPARSWRTSWRSPAAPRLGRRRARRARASTSARLRGARPAHDAGRARGGRRPARVRSRSAARAKTVRKAVRRVARHGWTIELVRGDELTPPLIAELAAVERAWRRRGHAGSTASPWPATGSGARPRTAATSTRSPATRRARRARSSATCPTAAASRSTRCAASTTSPTASATRSWPPRSQHAARRCGCDEVSLNFAGFGHLMAAETLERRSHRARPLGAAAPARPLPARAPGALRRQVRARMAAALPRLHARARGCRWPRCASCRPRRTSGRRRRARLGRLAARAAPDRRRRPARRAPSARPRPRWPAR